MGAHWLYHYYHQACGELVKGADLQTRTSKDNIRLLVQRGRLQLGRWLRCQTGKQFLDLRNGASWIQALGTGARAVHDSVATVHTEGILQLAQTFCGVLVTRIDDPAIGLHKHSRAQILLSIPPVRGARCGAASTQNALVQTIEFETILHRLQVLCLTLLLASFVPKLKAKRNSIRV